MKAQRIWSGLLMIVLASCGVKDEGLRPLPDLRAFHLHHGEQRTVTGWKQFQEDLTGIRHAYLREETFTFTNGASGRSFTVFDPEFRELGSISATGQVIRFVERRRDRSWQKEDLGVYAFVAAIILLTGLDAETAAGCRLSAMSYQDVGGG